MDVVFAPDWREGVPYQRLLSEALERQGVHVNDAMMDWTTGDQA